jgi:hypothetical protein
MTTTPSDEVPLLTAEAKLLLVKARIEKMLCDRLSTLNDEASVVHADMEALVARIHRKGHIAKVDDLKAGRWYRTASDLRLLQSVYTFVCATIGVPEGILKVAISEEESEPCSTDRDEVAEDP